MQPKIKTKNKKQKTKTQITNVGEDVEKREPFYTVGRNVNWYRFGGFSKN